jgi:hypothetical protein
MKDQLIRAFQPKFLHHVGTMNFDGFDAQTEKCCNLARAIPFANQPKNLKLARGQSRDCFVV